MLKRFNNLSLGRKINLGFMALVLVLLLVVVLIFIAGRQATDKINLTVDVRVPTTLAAASAQSNLLKMQAAVRGYLAVGDLKNIDDYNQAQEQFQQNLAELKVLSANWINADDVARLNELIEAFAAWLSIPQQLFKLHDNPLENQQALKLETTEVQPLNAALLANVDRMIEQRNSQLLRDARTGGTEADSTYLMNNALRDFRSSFDGMSTNLSAYAATGDLIFKFRYSAELVNNSRYFGQLGTALREEQASTNLLATENESSQHLFSQISNDRSAILELSSQVFAAVEGGQSHLDLYLFQNRMTPKTEQMIALLEELATGQQTLLQAELDDGKRSLTNLRYQTILGGIMVLLLGLAMVLIFRRNIAKPIHRLSMTAEQIGGGNLTARATVETNDEIGHLANTFNRMTGQLNETFQALAQAKETAETANRAKSRFLASMSHELRTPLNSILGYVQILRRDGNLNPPQTKAVDVVQHNGEHLLGFINDILDLSKIEASKLELLPKPIDLDEFLDGIHQMYRNRTRGSRGLIFRTHFADGLPTSVVADETRLRQILLNLLENAFKFTNKGEIVLSVDLLERDGDKAMLQFTVSDTGVGISEQELGSIFRPFEQVGDSQQRSQGSGLGLAITRELVYAMDGHLTVDSVVAEGSRFIFEALFPATWSSEIEASSLAQKQAHSDSNGTQPHITSTPERTAHHLQPACDSVTSPTKEESAILLDIALKGELPNLKAEVNKLAEQRPEYAQFAHKLNRLINQYEEDEIISILRKTSSES